MCLLIPLSAKPQMSAGLSYKECTPCTTMEEAKNVLRVTVMSILENAEIESLLNAAPVKAGSQIPGGGLAHSHCFLPSRNIQATGCLKKDCS